MSTEDEEPLMARSCRHIEVTRAGDVFCVRLRRPRMDEADVLELADELMALIDQDGCRKMALSLGPEQLVCLYSVFLAKLVMVRRHLADCGGRLIICEATPQTQGVFEACRLKEYFDFLPDVAGAAATLGKEE